MRETIRLGEGDTVYVIREKLEQVASGQVAVVVPRGHPALRSELSLVLLRRAAESLALDLVLVTNDHALAGLARAAGLRTASGGDGQAERARAPRVRTRLEGTLGLPERARAPLARPAVEPAPRQSRLGRRVTIPSLTWADLRQHVALFVVAVAAGLVLLLGLCLALPSATVVLQPKGEEVGVELGVLASTSVQQVDFEKSQVPARQVQTEVTDQETGQTTGKRSIVDKNATGDVVFVNKTNSEVTVPRGTVVRTADGETVKFYTLLDAVLPGGYGATTRVPVQAAEPGPGSNVAALTIRVVEGEPSYQVEVLNDKPVQGGSEKRVSVVASEDRDRLRASLVQKLQQKAYDELVANLNKGDWIPPDSLDVAITDEVFDRQVDEEAETLGLAMKVRVTGMAVDGQATRTLMSQALLGHGSESLVVNDATLQVEQPVGKVEVEGDIIRFRARAAAMLVPAVNLKAVSSRLAGRDPASAADWLASQCDLSSPPEIRIRPGWWPRLPWMPSRIQVRLSGGSG